jgi:hypothetical protein
VVVTVYGDIGWRRRGRQCTTDWSRDGNAQRGEVGVGWERSAVLTFKGESLWRGLRQTRGWVQTAERENDLAAPSNDEGLGKKQEL